MAPKLLLFTLVASLALPLRAADLVDLAWFSGYWQNTNGGTNQEELWGTVAANMLLGVHRDVYPSGKAAFEFMQIVQREDGIFYRASPGGGPATEFKLTTSTPGRVVFENLTHDYPQRITYTRSGDTLSARIEDAGGEKGSEWVWHRATLQ